MYFFLLGTRQNCSTATAVQKSKLGCLSILILQPGLLTGSEVDSWLMEEKMLPVLGKFLNVTKFFDLLFMV